MDTPIQIPKACPDCGLSFAGRPNAEAEYEEHKFACATWCNRTLLKPAEGVWRALGKPDAAKLRRHVELYGSEGASAWLA